MKQSFRRVIAVLLVVIMLSSLVTISAFAEETKADSDSSYYYGAFYYRPGTGEYDPGVEYADTYAYSDDYFKQSGREYNPHLATLSFSLAVASVSSTREPFTPEGYQRKNRNAIAFLEDTGFSDISINHDYTIKPTKDTIGIACGQKHIVQDGKEYTLLAVFPRSAGYEAEWGNNFVLGADGDAVGFDGCADTCLAFAKDYINEKKISGDIKVWTVGYSRGAAIANLMGKKLIDDPKGYLGDAITLTGDDLYAYTCGTPSAADVDNNPRDEKYKGIFNQFLDTELASAMAPPDMGFERYGTDKILYKAENYDKMLENLSKCNDYVYSTYKDSINSNQYHPKMLGISDGSIGMVDDPNSYIPTDPAEYLKGLCAYLTEFTGGREEYAKTYEQAFSDVIAYYESLSSEESAAMMSSLTGNDDTIYMAVAFYAYFMKLKSEANISLNEEQVNAKAEEIAAVAAGNEDLSATGIDAQVIAKAAAKLASYLMMSADDVKSIAANYFSSVFGAAMRASGATAQELKNVTGKNASLALVHVISHLLFGNIWQSDDVYPLLLNNEQMKAAATLIGNAAYLFVDHANEIITSWLKLDDSYYENYAALTDAQLMGYRRVYVKAADASLIDGTITDANGTVIAQIENGVLKNSADRWVGFTSTDEGGFFRVPVDGDYKVNLHSAKAAQIAVEIGEYSLYDAKTEMVLNDVVNAKATDVVEVSLPAMDEKEGMPSDTEYAVTVTGQADAELLGDVDGNGTVEAVDATWTQRHIGQIVTLSDQQLAAADVDQDRAITPIDVTLIQRYLVDMKSSDDIGKTIA